MVSQPVVRRVLLPASVVVLFAGLVLASIPYFFGRVFAVRDAMLSNLASRGENPHGYLFADAGMILCGLLLMPVALWLFRMLRRVHFAVAGAGAMLFGAGLVGAVLFGATGPFEDGYSAVHIYSAYAMFLLLASGILVLMALVTFPAVAAGRGVRLMLATMLQACVLGFLVYLVMGEGRGGGFFDNASVLHSVALCEWTLCGLNLLYVHGLVGSIAGYERLGL